MTENMNVNVGVTEGDALSDILFNLVLNYIIKNLDIREIQQLNWYRSVLCVWCDHNMFDSKRTGRRITEIR